MRLTHIKLAGFKSFVDPTVIPTPSQLVGVVGPNGCGKSNIIDAVRWVLGESRASELRGESMQDVIFNGSGNRKPAARASVELVFDNSEGRASGQWGAFSEISVGRVLTRDGTSSYFINNQQVRRRDINDMFLGTGLGARGYAIIGQGMINRLIEAKPEELRVYLEEAAGVSRYKERRRETENRLADTRENLVRLEDILQELDAQLERLGQQAEVAAHYKALQEEGELKQHVLWWLRESHAHDDRQKKSVAIQQAQTRLEAVIGGARALETKIESLRQAHYTVSDEVHAAQTALFEAGANVSSLEAEIRHAVDARERLAHRQEQLTAQQAEWTEQKEHSEQELEALAQQLEEAAANIVEAQAHTEHLHDHLPEMEEQMRRLATQRDELRITLSRLEQRLALAAQTAADLTRQSQQLSVRQERLEKEKNELQLPQSDDLQHLEGEQAQLSVQLDEAQQQLQALEAELPQLEQHYRQAQSELQTRQAQHAKLEARLTALEQLQADVQRQDKLEPWLQTNQLAERPRLWQQLNISSGWETAVEAALRDRVTALQLSDLNDLLPLLNEPPPSRVSFFAFPELEGEQANDVRSLSHKINVSNPHLQRLINQWLADTLICDDVQQAISQRAELSVGQRFICPQGHCVDANSVQFYAPDHAQAGVLARQQEIQNIHKELKASKITVDEAETRRQQAHQQREQVSLRLPSVRQRMAELTSRLHSVQMEHARLQQVSQQANERMNRLQDELDEIAYSQETIIAQVEENELEQEQVSEQIDQVREQFEEAEQACEKVNGSLEEARYQLRDRERVVQEAQHAERLLQARHQELYRTQRLAQEQLLRAQGELQGLQGELIEMDAAPTQAGLQEALERRAECEEHLLVTRQRLDTVAAELREAEAEKGGQEQELEPLRQQVTELQLQEQAARLSVEQYSQLLDERKVDRSAIAQMLSEKSEQWQRLGWLQAEVQRISRQIDALGAVNLAALEELKAAQERQGYLNEQHADLNLAIETLEDAIRKIDKETRDLLMGTFNAVNTHFGELFPKLFGGGEAKLSLSGDDVLNAGVLIMAQPPGKRNSTIHLLSGGEKALTATALVFALFKLNPAPFCLLDEVDAPLDDANTERYAQLVTSMSEQTQFLFISHNKIAMHMAKQLVGVTMQEQGVSRIVAVDVESAMQMAEA